jgi:hypothetical protein
VNAAKPGDWILVGPGDYHENADETGPYGNPSDGQMGGVYIDKSGITLRGMNRNTVIVDGTRPGYGACSSNPAAQNYGRTGPGGVPVGRNGILIWKANDVTVENLTACNFMAGSGDSGNQIWWNGGDNSGSYIGACGQRCDAVLDHMWMEHNVFSHNGFFKNPTNSDFGQIDLFAGEPENCFAGNRAPDGSAPSNLEATQPTCGAVTTSANTGGELLPQVLCDTGFAACPSNAIYPHPNGTLILKPLPKMLPTMPNPCAGVPANPWCPAPRAR